MNIMVIDDEHMIRRGIIKIIEKYCVGCTVIAEAEDGVEALSQLETNRVDVLITDMRMPLMDGIQLLERAQHFPHLKKIVMSGYEDYHYVRNAMKLGAVDYLLKPIDNEELIKLLHKLSVQLKNKSNMQERDEQDIIDIENWKSKFEELLLEGRKESLNATLEQFGKEVRSNRVHPALLHSMLQQFYLGFMSNIPWFSQVMKSEYSGDEYGYLKELEHLNFLDEILDSMEELINNCMDRFTDSNDTRNKKRIEESIEYIKTHYQRNLTLTMVANYCSVNPNYFSELFKLETGENFSDFLSRTRINRAKELLQDASWKTYEIGQQVGYEDPAYFSKVFKKWVGVSPNAFRNLSAVKNKE